MCPEPALLVAYLDGTVFHRDAHAIDSHLEGCASCTDLVAAMRRHRAAEERSRRARIWRRAGIAVCTIALLAIGTRTLVTRPRSAESALTSLPPQAPATRASPPLAAPAPARQAPPSLASTSARRATADTSRAPARQGERPQPQTMWRVRDRVVEQSTDAGATWLADYTADRNIRASAFVGADVGWIVGENGLILRRTKNGWFSASPPADATISAVRASSPSRATVTLDDGRVFTTINGGVTWTTP
jgi:type IV secretory pathway VirB10-like protein